MTDEKNCAQQYIVHGFSMWPAVRHGNVIDVKPVVLFELRAGNIIVYQPDGQNEPVVHRVIRAYNKSGPAFVLARGDNARGDPERVFEDILRGRVVAVAGMRLRRPMTRLEEQFWLHFGQSYRRIHSALARLVWRFLWRKAAWAVRVE